MTTRHDPDRYRIALAAAFMDMGLDDELACMLVHALEHQPGGDLKIDADAIEVFMEAGQVLGMSVEDLKRIGAVIGKSGLEPTS